MFKDKYNEYKDLFELEFNKKIKRMVQMQEEKTEIKEIPKKTKHIVVNNEQLESYIKIVKKDLKTGKNVTGCHKSDILPLAFTCEIYCNCDNYVNLFVDDSVFLIAAKNTFVFALFTTSGHIQISFIIIYF